MCVYSHSLHTYAPVHTGVHTHTYTHTHNTELLQAVGGFPQLILEFEGFPGLATHSSVLAWRIPRTGEPGGLPSMGSHRVGHD